MLLMLGADPSARGRQPHSVTPLHLAARAGHVDLIRLLLKAGAEPHVEAKHADASGWVPLHMAAAGGHFRAVRVLLDGGAELRRRNSMGQSALHIAAEHGHVGAVVALAGTPDVGLDEPDNDGCTPLMAAARSGHAQVVEALVAAGAAVEAQVGMCAGGGLGLRGWGGTLGWGGKVPQWSSWIVLQR